MQLRATPEERALQDEVRTFLAQAPLVGADLPRGLDDRMELLREWQASCYDGRLRRPRVAERVRRRRATARRADHRRPGARRRRRSRVHQRGRARRPRPVAAALRQRRAATPLRPVDPVGRGDLVPGLLRARGRVRPRVAAHARDRARRPLRAQRPEDVGLLGPVRALVRRAGPDRGDRPEAPRHLDADRRHALPGRRACDR